MLAGFRTVARVMSRAHSDFGTLPDGTQTVSDVRDLLANWDPRVQHLNEQAGGVQVDGTFTTDLAGLNNRYRAAADPARKALSDTSWLPSADVRPMQGAYDAILGALKQVPGTISKGDYDDLIARLSDAQAANGQPTAMSSEPTVQPTTQDVGMGVYKALASVDFLGMFTGQEAWKNPLAPPDAPPDPLAKLEWLILLASLGLGGLFTVKLLVAPAIKTVAWLAGTVGGGYVAYKGTAAVGQALGKLQNSTAGKVLGA